MCVSDKRDYFLLIFCALKNNLMAMKMIYEHVMGHGEHEGEKARITNWVNKQTDKGFNALHYASFHGNLDMVKYLIDDLNANIYDRNNQG